MTMNRIINNADLVVEDMLKGWLVAHADTVVATDNSRVVKRARAPEAGKVGVVTGGGSGHEPAFLGYVGDGMVDAVAIGEIFSSIAHQWKNPLVEIATIAQEHVYSCNEQGDEKNSPYVHDIMVQVRYMTDTINDFQKFIMPSTAKSVFNVQEAIETMMKIISHTIKYNYIDVSIDSTKATNLNVLGYKNEFMQTLLNIVNNAKEQMKELRDAKKIKRGHIDIRIYNSSKKVIIEISDNAGGIPEDALAHVFDAYFTTKEQGHGIGLYMSKLIIEDKMGGKIRASNTNEGACFTITLGNVT